MIVRRAPAEHLPWLAERAKINLHPGIAALEAVREDGTIVAMVGYEQHFPHAGMMHVALAYPAAGRHILPLAFRIAFDPRPQGYGWVEVFSPVRDDNAAALKLDEHLGFKRFHHGKDWMRPGVGLVWMAMRREECRFLEKDGG